MNSKTRFMIGLPLEHNELFMQTALANSGKIHEVYFSWPGIASGRGTGTVRHKNAEEKQVELLNDLAAFDDRGIAQNLLLNGNCYGADSLSRSFFQHIGDVVDSLMENFTLSSVTTSSPVIARFLKQNFPALERRASVNMEIGTAQGMEYLADVFDGYYMKREYNRNMPVIKQLRNWCDANGKKLYALANSGCLNYCSVHNFHDNLVAHEQEIARQDNAYSFNSACSNFLSTGERRGRFLQVTNFIRPEDIHLYDGLFDGIKLATRSNPRPVNILNAYFKCRFGGNLAELLEPDHTASFLPEIISNRDIDCEWLQKVLVCSKECDDGNYCRDVLAAAIVNLDKI